VPRPFIDKEKEKKLKLRMSALFIATAVNRINDECPCHMPRVWEHIRRDHESKACDVRALKCNKTRVKQVNLRRCFPGMQSHEHTMACQLEIATVLSSFYITQNERKEIAPWRPSLTPKKKDDRSRGSSK
jgi:hypothetical protein